MKKAFSTFSVLLLSSILVLGSCGGSSDDNADFKSSVVGASGEAGKLSIYLGEAVNTSSVKINEGEDLQSITGQVEIENAITELSGTYDTATKAVILNGGNYSFLGETNAEGEIEGTYTKGEEEGIFAGFDSSTNEVIVYCGTYDSNECIDLGCSGAWSVTTSSGGHAVGTYFGNNGSSSGTLWVDFEGNTITGQDDEGSIMTGTVSNGVVTGTWTLTEGLDTTTGTFEASTEACP